MNILELILWVTLAALSVAAVACFVTALQVCLFTKDQNGVKSQVEHYFAELKHLSEQAKAGVLQDYSARLARLAKRLEELESLSGLAAVMHFVISPKKDLLDLNTVIGLSLGRVERRARAVCAFLTRFAPQTGLAGMLLGAQQAISNAGAGGSSDQLNTGIALALVTTLWGVLCAMVTFATTSLIWEPYLVRQAVRLHERAVITASLLIPIKTRRQDWVASPDPVTAHRAPAEVASSIHSHDATLKTPSGNGATSPCETNS